MQVYLRKALFQARVFLIAAVCVSAVFGTSACAYRFGPHNRQLPGGHQKVYIKLFENKTQEVGIEPDWTNAFTQEMARTGIATVTTKENAELIVVGTIHTVDFYAKTPIPVRASKDSPDGKAITRSMFTEYQTRVTIVLKAVDKDNKELWQGQFMGEKNYKAPQLTTYGLRTANPLYNQNARRQTIQAIAKDVAFEAVNRMTENF
ncbi:MAG: hypothetical protein IT287_04165 [Bdellovibrionaceae bacterium]|nr:hypothetical protein [Pseudobdellovibrionaceae bacterium]